MLIDLIWFRHGRRKLVSSTFVMLHKMPLIKLKTIVNWYTVHILNLSELLRKKRKALNGSNRRVLAEAYNDLATYYYKHNRYSDALDEYKAEASICKDLGLRMEWGTCNRMVGEMYMLLAEFDKALKYEERHLGSFFLSTPSGINTGIWSFLDCHHIWCVTECTALSV